MKIGELVKFRSAPSSPIGIVVYARRPIARGGQWYYLVRWSDDIYSGSYCTRGVVEVISESR